MKTLLSILTLVLLTSLAPATQVRITGTVTDSSGTPLSGVSVTIKGTGTSVTTGSNGTYSIIAGADAKTLVFSFPAMNPVEEKIAGRTVINIVMTATNQPVKDEVAVEMEVMESISYDRAKEHKSYPSGAARTPNHQSYRYVAPVTVENTESYSSVTENGYKDPPKSPVFNFLYRCRQCFLFQCTPIHQPRSAGARRCSPYRGDDQLLQI